MPNFQRVKFNLTHLQTSPQIFTLNCNRGLYYGQYGNIFNLFNDLFFQFNHFDLGVDLFKSSTTTTLNSDSSLWRFSKSEWNQFVQTVFRAI